MALGRPMVELILTDDDRSTLERWALRPKSFQRLALRAEIVLACNDRNTNTAVADQLCVSIPTVGKWKQRFVDSRLEGLVDEQLSRCRWTDKPAEQPQMVYNKRRRLKRSRHEILQRLRSERVE